MNDIIELSRKIPADRVDLLPRLYELDETEQEQGPEKITEGEE